VGGEPRSCKFKAAIANPALTLARGFTTTFAGIAINHVPGFVVAQFIGAGIAAVVAAVLLAVPPLRT
jgi:glycerol uptake facilitator-like aquaporin